ncbi:hypothetical protein E3N88_01521 [Mikania micrantha]|uniref:Protein kinase domain-containing protein n=1 Tax=Mikania micrantha TaxID=192012 RepID=A0A5N6Q169_9ASTR|nr:hypothetical protein E3N88_01521 [Mikania micrantha]
MKLLQAYHLPMIIFLLLAASLAVPKYSKRGCKDTIGNIRIPFPFGIGEDCSVNPWYNVDCISSKPYLSEALNHPEVLSVNLEDQTVTVNMPKISGCSQTMSIDLGRSPFLYSKSHNKLVAEGCGNAVDHDGPWERSHRICCQTTIPYYLKSYTVNLTRLERQSGDGGCGSAFLVDKNLSNDPFVVRNGSFVPVSLLWTLADSDQVMCCHYGMTKRLKVDTRNGATMDTWKCSNEYYNYNYNNYRPFEGSPYLIDGCQDTEECAKCEVVKDYYCDYTRIYDVDGLTKEWNFTCGYHGHYDDTKIMVIVYSILAAASLAVPKHSKPGCKDTCGNIRVPYPFGIGAKCSVNPWYIVDCNSSKPYLSAALNHLEILSVNLEDQTVTVNMPKISDCTNGSQIKSIDLGRSPFLYSKSHNNFVVEGCGNAVMMNHGSTLTGCSASCDNVTVGNENTCLGFSCCQTTIPYYLKSYTMNLTRLDRQAGGYGGCRSAFLADKNSSDDPFVVRDGSFVPVSLLWTLSDHDKHKVTCCDALNGGLVVDTGNGTTLITWKCSHDSRPSEGSPYLIDGCQDTEECAKCQGDNGRYCDYTRIYDVDGLAKEWNFTCGYTVDYSYSRINRRIPIYAGAGITSLLGLIAIIYTLYKVIRKTITKRQRKSVFKRINGGLLLKQQEEIDPSLVNKTILFTSRELAKATDNFNENRVLGRGGQGTVYKGMLADGKIVAVKKSKLDDESQLEQFINEVVILSQVNHRNLVKLLGCCLETEVPLLVFEFIPNGNLYDCIHDESHEFPLSLNMRLQIATEVAQALAYLHSATSIPIYHRDIKTSNILLDDKYRAKVSDFGTSRFVSMDQTHLTTLVKGTLGYLDPEYFQSNQFTEKSDVYSFGVVMVELLTGEMSISRTRFGENRSLVAHFMLAMEEGRVMSIFDAKVVKEGTRGELLNLANIAMQCLNPIGKNRPSMKELAAELEIIRTSHIPFMVQTNIEVSNKGVHNSSGVLDYVHADLWGPARTLSLGGARFFLSIVDDYSRKVWVFVLKTKDETFGKFKDWKVLVEHQTRRKVKKLRTDNGLEFCNSEFNHYCKKYGIARHLTVVGTSQQNGLAERMNETLLNKVRYLLFGCGMPKKFWAEALYTTAGLVNLSPSSALGMLTPTEKWSGKPGDYKRLRVFGCLAYAHVSCDTSYNEAYVSRNDDRIREIRKIRFKTMKLDLLGSTKTHCESRYATTDQLPPPRYAACFGNRIIILIAAVRGVALWAASAVTTSRRATLILLSKRISQTQSYADKRRKPLEFDVGDRVMLKVSPWKGVVRFGAKGKLAPRYVGPFEITQRIGPVAYRLRLPDELSGVHDVFHVSNLKRCLADESLIIPLEEIQVDEQLHFIEEPVEIMEREVKKLKRSRIPIVKVRWNSKRGPEFTWEREDNMKAKYPHLFEK